MPSCWLALPDPTKASSIVKYVAQDCSVAWPGPAALVKHCLSPVALHKPALHRTLLHLIIVHIDSLPQIVLCLFSLTRKHLSLRSPGPAQTPLLCWGTVTRVSGCVPVLNLTPVDWNLHIGLLSPCPVFFLPTPGGYSL